MSEYIVENSIDTYLEANLAKAPVPSNTTIENLSLENLQAVQQTLTLLNNPPEDISKYSFFTYPSRGFFKKNKELSYMEFYVPGVGKLTNIKHYLLNEEITEVSIDQYRKILSYFIMLIYQDPEYTKLADALYNSQFGRDANGKLHAAIKGVNLDLQQKPKGGNRKSRKGKKAKISKRRSRSKLSQYR